MVITSVYKRAAVTTSRAKVTAMSRPQKCTGVAHVAMFRWAERVSTHVKLSLDWSRGTSRTQEATQPDDVVVCGYQGPTHFGVKDIHEPRFR